MSSVPLKSALTLRVAGVQTLEALLADAAAATCFQVTCKGDVTGDSTGPAGISLDGILPTAKLDAQHVLRIFLGVALELGEDHAS